MVRERVRVRMLVSAAILLAVALPWFEADRIWGAASSDGAITPIEVSGRTVCPGSVAAVMTNLTGAPADAVEQLQAKYENVDGFRGVVFDGKGAVVIASPETLGS